MDHHQDPRFHHLVRLFTEFSEVSGQLQLDMSTALMSSEANKNTLRKQLKGSEESMQRILDKSVRGFVGAMPLASMNQVNLFIMALGLHTNLTGNSLIHDIIDHINQIAQAQEFN